MRSFESTAPVAIQLPMSSGCPKSSWLANPRLPGSFSNAASLSPGEMDTRPGLPYFLPVRKYLRNLFEVK